MPRTLVPSIRDLRLHRKSPVRWTLGVPTIGRPVMKDPAQGGLGAEASRDVAQPVPTADNSVPLDPIGVSDEELVALADLWPSKTPPGTTRASSG